MNGNTKYSPGFSVSWKEPSPLGKFVLCVACRKYDCFLKNFSIKGSTNLKLSNMLAPGE